MHLLAVTALLFHLAAGMAMMNIRGQRALQGGMTGSVVGGGLINGMEMNAAEGLFWLNRSSSAYRPSEKVGVDCAASPLSKTVVEFVLNGGRGDRGNLSLYVAVPGGQASKALLSSRFL